MELVKESIEYNKRKRENKLLKWIMHNQIFSIVIVFTLIFSTINIILIINFFKIISNF